MDEVWSGYPQRGVPHREIMKKKTEYLFFIWGKDYQELRENRLYLWKRRKKVKLIVIKKEGSLKCIVGSEETIGCRAALRFKLDTLEEKENVRVKIDGKEVSSRGHSSE